MEKSKIVHIVYGSETGTSYDLAKQFILTFAYQFQHRLINVQYLQTLESSQDHLWVFFISTTGQGDFPYSMKNFWKKIMMKSFPNQKELKFAIYALGDRSYGDNFCLAARKLRQRLLNLQGIQIVEIGLGDDQQKNGYLQQYHQTWFPKIQQYINNFATKTKELLLKTISFENEIQKQQLYETIKVVVKRQICQNKGRRTFFIDLEIQDQKQKNLKIKMGDILCIYPHNNPENVKKMLAYFDIQDKNEIVNNKRFNGKLPSYQQLFSQVLNISSYVNHSFFVNRLDLKPLSQFTSNNMFKQKLIQLQKDFDEYYNYIKKYKRNVVQVIDDFQLQIPIQDFIARINFVPSRKYSVSEILQYQNNRTIIRLLIRLTQQKISQFRIHNGLCTHDLAIWSPIGSLRKGKIIQGQFNFNQQAQNKIILMTLGTGIAPFIQLLNQAKKSQNSWKINLYYTNRFKNQLYYPQLFQTLHKFQVLQPTIEYTGEGGKRITRLVEENLLPIKQFYQEYVSFLTEKKQNKTFKMMICGPKTTCEAIQNILQKHLDLDIKMLKKKKVFVYQNW